MFWCGGYCGNLLPELGVIREDADLVALVAGVVDGPLLVESSSEDDDSDLLGGLLGLLGHLPSPFLCWVYSQSGYVLASALRFRMWS